jgi:5-methylcytosine-specific restriction enzyme A
MCQKRGDIVRAKVVDHIRPISAGGHKRDPANLQSLCIQHHNATKQKMDRRRTIIGCDEFGAPLNQADGAFNQWNRSAGDRRTPRKMSRQ